MVNNVSGNYSYSIPLLSKQNLLWLN